jgi:hypothetical protein
MRRIYTLAVLSLFSIAVMAQMLPDNWTVNSSAFTVEQESTIVNDGLSSVLVTWTSTSNQDFHSDPFDVTADAAFTYTLDVYDNDDAGRVRMSVIWSTGNDYQEVYSVDQDSWQTLTYSGTVPSDVTTAYVKIRFYDVGANWDGDAVVYIDNAVYSEDGGTTNLIANASFEDWSEPVIPEYTIYEIQGQTEDSPYDGVQVLTYGVVTATFSSGYFIQNDVGAWNGLYVYDNVNTPVIGDSLVLVGIVDEYNNKTELTNISSFSLVTSGNELPAALPLTTGEISDEMYEGVYVVVENVMCTSEPDGNNEWGVDDGSGIVLIDDLMYAHASEYGDLYNIAGIVDYSFGDFKIEPRNEDDVEYLGSAIENALADAAANTSMEITPATQTITEGDDAVMNANVVYPSTIDALLVDYYMDAVIDFGTALPNDVDVTVTYSQNGSTPTELGTFIVTSGTTESYLSDILGTPRTLLSGHAGLELDWGITVVGLTAGTYNITMETVTNLDTEFGADDYVLATDDAEIIVGGEIEILSYPENTVICNGEEAEFVIEVDGEEPITYEWFYNSELIPDSDENTIMASEAGEYYCVVSNDFDMVQSETWTLSISIPQVDLGEDATYCQSFNIELDAGEFESYLWNTNEDTQTISPDTSGTFIVDVEDMYGCTASGEVTITFDPEWSFDLPASETLCEGTTVVFEMPMANAWVWSTGEITQSIEVDTAGMVYVTVTQGSCVVVDSVNVEYSANPNPIELGDTIYLCIGDTILISSPTYAPQYLWSTGATSNSIEVTEEGTYSLTIFNNAGCSQYDEVYVEFNDYMVVNIGDSIYSCEGLEVKLSPGLVDSLYWSNETDVDSLVVNTTGWYYVTVVDDLGCEGADSAYVFFNELPEFTLGNDTAFCDGNSLTITAPEAIEYLWSNDEITQSIDVESSGAYTVTITDDNGCQNYDSKVLTVWDNPFVDLGPDKTISEDQTIILGTEPGNASYAWSTGAVTDYIVINGAALGIGEHLISVTVVSGNDCESYDEIVITVIEGVGIQNNLASQISVYPNPATTTLQIEMGSIKDFEILRIMDVNGKFLSESSTLIDVYSIDVEDWQNGMYFIQIVTKSEILNLKFIKE